jgi:hypothetical protein
LNFHFQLKKPPTCPLRPIIPNNTSPLRITAAAGTELARTSFSNNVIIFFDERVLQPNSLLYILRYIRENWKSPLTHAILLDQAFAYCPIFLTADFRRSLGRVSVPMWLIILSDQLRIVGLVGFYPTNYLILHRLF